MNFVPKPYKVGYYDATVDGGGHQVCTDCGGISTSGGNFSSQFDCMSAVVAAGTWHSVVFNTTGNIPQNYSDVLNDTNRTAEDYFEVTEDAIPEFPAVIAAIAVCMMCAVAYLVMRRNKYGKE